VRRLASSFALISCLWISVDTRLAAQQVSRDCPSPTQTVPQAQQSSGLPGRTVSLRRLPTNILKDQKTIFSFPQALAKGQHWWPTIGVTAGTGALVASDPYTAPPFLTTNSFSGFNRVFSSANTAAFIAAVPATMYGVGWLRKDSYARNTALLAGEALADGFILAIPFKGIAGRRQPLTYTGNGPYSDSFFNGSHNPFSSGGFYSQHAMAATAVATVIAVRYRRHRWVPYVAYGLAGAISFSRLTRSAHFPGDVFFGGAMGYVISRYAVLPVQN
jgi:membrane-associated phospholipid phosphatase